MGNCTAVGGGGCAGYGRGGAGRGVPVLWACGTSGWSGSRPRFALLSRTPFRPPPAPPSLIGFPCAIRDRKVVRPSRSQSAASSALVSRSRAMPVGGPHRETGQRSAVARREGGWRYAVSAVAGCKGVWGTVVRPPAAGCAGLKTGVPGPVRHPARGGTCRDGGPLHGLVHGLAVRRSRRPAGRGAGRRRRPGTQRWCGPHVRRAPRHRRWFRAPARCRSEAPTGRLASAPLSRAVRVFGVPSSARLRRAVPV